MAISVMLTHSKARITMGFVAAIAAFACGASTAIAQDQQRLESAPQAPLAAPADSALTPLPPAQAAPTYSMEDLSFLLAPIALYPDPLLALVLSASTFPVQVVELDRWLSANAAAVSRRDFTQVDAMSWDGSVQALARFPDEVRMLAEHLDWSQSLGLAFSLQPTDVAAAVQMLRAKAEGIGNLKSTPEQVVNARRRRLKNYLHFPRPIPSGSMSRAIIPRVSSRHSFQERLSLPQAFRWVRPGITVGDGTIEVGTRLWINQPVWHTPPSTAIRGQTDQAPVVHPARGGRIVRACDLIVRICGQTAREPIVLIDRISTGPAPIALSVPTQIVLTARV